MGDGWLPSREQPEAWATWCPGLCLNGGNFMNLSQSSFLSSVTLHSSPLLPGLLPKRTAGLGLWFGVETIVGGGWVTEHCGSVTWLSILQCFCETGSGVSNDSGQAEAGTGEEGPEEHPSHFRSQSHLPHLSKTLSVPKPGYPLLHVEDSTPASLISELGRFWKQRYPNTHVRPVV